MMKNITSHLKNNLEFIISALGIFIVVVLLWAPFGPRTTDIADGWLNLPNVERTAFVSLLNSARPLVYLPWEIASHISKDSYLGVGLVLASIFWGKSFVLYAILRKLRLVSPQVAFLIAILFILYPADSGNFLMRALGRHTGVFFYFLAVLLLILASQHFNFVYLVGMLLAEGISALISEQGFPLILVTPALLLLNNNCPKKRKVVISFIWYLVLFLSVINFLLAPKGHQEKILDVALSSEYIKKIVLSNLVAYQRIFLDGWWKAFQHLINTQWKFIFFAILITCIAGIIAYMLSWFIKDHDAEANTSHLFMGMIVVSLVVIGLSFFPYSITRFRYETSRVFYYAAAGGALATGLFFFKLKLMMSSRFRKIINISVWGITIFLVSINGLTQHSYLVERSLTQQNILVSIVEQAPSVKPYTFIVLVSGDQRPFTNLDYVFRAALSWTYQDPNIRAMQCSDVQDCLSKDLPVEQAILFESTENNDLTLLDKLPVDSLIANKYQPYTRIKNYVPFPERVQKAFDVKPEPNEIAPKEWESNGQTLNDRRVCNISHTGNCSLLFYNDETLTTFSQKIALTGNPGEHLKFSFWLKSEKRINTLIPFATLTAFYNDGTHDSLIISGQSKKSWTVQHLDFETQKAYVGLSIQLHSNVPLLIWMDDIKLSINDSDIFLENSSFEK